MSADIRLAQATAAVVQKRLAAGLGYLRIPEIVSPFPVTELLGQLAGLGPTRYAIFLDDVSVSESERVTTRVHEAIRWRNDPDVGDNLLVIGDLERDRAAGLASLPSITATEVRQQLLDELVAEANSGSASAKTVKLLHALKSERINLDLQHLADYGDSLAPTFGSKDLSTAVADLWRLKLLPDRPSADVDVRRLRDNAQRVEEVRQSDATAIQRLVSKLASQQAGNYEALRLFAATGKREHLRHLSLDAVREALQSARTDANGGDGDSDGTQKTERTQFLEAVRSGNVDEFEFLDQFAEDPDDDSPHSISANGTDLNWDRVSQIQLGPLLEEDGGVRYAESAGSLESVSPDEPDPLPGKGDVSWGRLPDLLDELANIEGDVEVPDPPTKTLQQIIDLRRQLEPFASDLPREGVRLFLAAPSLAEAARQLVDRWVVFWRGMEQLRSETPEVGELQQIGRKLALTDTRVVEQGTAVTAYLLPLHAIALEPRVRAAAMFREHPELDEDFFQLVVGSLDPAVPSIKLPVGDTNYDLAYSGQFRSLPQYERRAQQFHSPDLLRALQDVFDRFVNVHPYSRRSLRVALVDPTAETSKQVLKWLANVDVSRRERVAMDVYVQRESYDEVQAKLAEAQEELVSAEIAGSRFTYWVERLGRIEDLHDLISRSDRSPHVLCLFDPAEVTSNSTPIANLTPVLGSLVNEWEFGARARKEATPYIRPRTGSTSLNDFLTAQARLLGTDSVGTTERTPLLPPPVLATLASIGADTSWVVVAQGASALVAPPSISDLELLGRVSSGHHAAFVYSETPAFVLEPVFGYLQQHAYLQADAQDLTRFVLNTIRLALPEGLLGFYKRQGVLSDESVLGRLGLAAVVAYLGAAPDNPSSLIVSLDTEGARNWLGLREGVPRRSDLIRFTFSGDSCSIEAIEVKARSGSVSWGANPPEVVQEAVAQVGTMRQLLAQIFSSDSNDQLVSSRREILKRQVFLEALHQWEPLREEQPAVYRNQIASLNRLFSRGPDRLHVQPSERIFLATPGDDGLGVDGVAMRKVGDIAVVQLGLGWFRALLAQQPGGSITLDPGLLDMLGVSLEPQGVDGQEDTSADTAGPGAAPTLPTASSDTAPPSSDLNADVTPDQSLQQAPSGNESAAHTHSSTPGEDLQALLSRLQGSFRARGIPYISISSAEAVVGPSVVQLPVRLEVGARTSQVESQSDDIARDLGVQAFRITNYQGRPGYALAEVPRAERQIPDVTTLERPGLPYPAIAVGASLDFRPYWQCLDEIPHLLIAGKTGSGKSVLIRSLLWQLTRLYEPSEIDLVLIGPKEADYMDFSTAPHFKSPTDVHLRVDGAIDLLREIVEVRYRHQQAAFDEYARAALRAGRRISNLRELLAHAAATEQQTPLRPFVVVIDEFVELLDAGPSTRKEFESLVARFSRLFRYIGGTMIAATQRPSVRNITGDIKANFRPLALRVERSVDSRVILDENGAEQLIGHGDSLYKADEGLIRLQAYSALGLYVD